MFFSTENVRKIKESLSELKQMLDETKDKVVDENPSAHDIPVLKDYIEEVRKSW